MQVWNVLHTARWKYSTRKIAKNSPSLHHRTTLSGQSEQNLLSSNISRCPPQYGELRPVAEISPVVWGTPANFNGFRFLAALLHSTPVVGVSQTTRHWTEAATYIQQGGHHVGHLPTFCVNISLNAVWLEMCLVDIAGIHFPITAQHWNSGHAALKFILLKVSWGEFVH